MKRFLLVLSVLAISLTLTGCKDKYDNLDNSVSGTIDLMLWSGSGTYFEDIGRDTALDPTTLTAQNDAAAYYVAQEFNKLYPNVQINVLAVEGGPNDGKIWSQELANFEAEHEAFPGIWATVDLPGDIERGLVADLSRFESDPLYQAMNPSIMEMMNYYGFQGGLPQYILPWGIYVNRELAEDYNIDEPEIDWTIDEYTDFQKHSKTDVYYGSMDTPLRIIETGTNDITKSLFNYTDGDTFLDINSTEVRDLVQYLDEWTENSVWEGDSSDEFKSSLGWYDYNFFKEGKLLTLEGQPWMMGDCASPSTAEQPWEGACTSSDWDIYPRPSTDYVDNTVGIVLDPMSVYNYCLDDGDTACTEEEELRIKVAYTFASFWIADSRSWTARAEGQFYDKTNEVNSSSLNDSFPVTTGELFEEQMEIWYTPTKHQRFKDQSLMPGFHEVVRIYEAGQFWDISDKAFPYYYNVEGTRQENLYEWKNYWVEEVNSGKVKGDPDFLSTLRSNLPKWNEDANARFKESFEGMISGLKRFYGFTDADITGTTEEE